METNQYNVHAEQDKTKKEVEDFLNKGIVIHPSGEAELLSMARGFLGA